MPDDSALHRIASDVHARRRAFGGGGVGIAWRAEFDAAIRDAQDVDFVEVPVDELWATGPDGEVLRRLRSLDLTVVPHCAVLSLGSAAAPDRGRLEELARIADRLDAPLVSDHVAFVRSNAQDVWHLLPVAFTRETLDVMSENIVLAQRVLDRPLALENIANLFVWPDSEMDEAAFLAELLHRTGARLLLDLENLRINAANFGFDSGAWLDRLPLDQVAYVHVAGSELRDGVWRDTHSEPIGVDTLDLLTELCARRPAPPVVLERDVNVPDSAGLDAELRRVRAAIRRRP